LKILFRRLLNFIDSRYNLSRNNEDIRKYLSSGQKPWTTGYDDYKKMFISKSLIDHELLDLFFHGKSLPDGYGFRLDERCVEYPWFFSRLDHANSSLLDAGSALNFDYLLGLPILENKNIVIYTLSPERTFPRSNISYIYGDLRQTIIRGDCFDCIVSISTLEHIGMDNTALYSRDQRFAESRPRDYMKVIEEFRRLLKSGGKLFITVPFGFYKNHGWLQIFDEVMVNSVIDTFDSSGSQITYYKYFADGWQISTANDCAECTYFDIHHQKIYDTDYAAAARAVVCIELTK
jgi:SAM-dependent methyltransferase